MLGSDISLTSLALRLLTEAECKSVLSDDKAETCEWETNGFTFVMSTKHLGILRTGAMGGDVREVHGGWKYLRPRDLYKEWREITSLVPAFSRSKRPGNFTNIVVRKDK